MTHAVFPAYRRHEIRHFQLRFAAGSDSQHLGAADQADLKHQHVEIPDMHSMPNVCELRPLQLDPTLDSSAPQGFLNLPRLFWPPQSRRMVSRANSCVPASSSVFSGKMVAGVLATGCAQQGNRMNGNLKDTTSSHCPAGAVFSLVLRFPRTALRLSWAIFDASLRDETTNVVR